MRHSNQEIFTRFIKFGKISTKRERAKIIEIVKEWKFVPMENSNIEKKYLDTINTYTVDKNINSILNFQPHLKEEFIKKLFSLLEKIDAAIEHQPTFLQEEKLLKKYEKFNLSEQNIGTQIYQKSKIIEPKKIKQYKNILQKVLNEKQVTKERKFIQFQQKISGNWAKLITNQATSLLALGFQKMGAITTEEKLKTTFDQLTITQFKKEWKSWNNYKEFFKTKYRKRDFDLNKYQEEFIAIEQTDFQVDETKLTAAKENFIVDWKSQLSLAKIQQNIKLIDETRAQFLKDLYAKIEDLKELLKLLAPFLNETGKLGRLWDMSAGNWQNANFSLLEKYAQILKHKKEIQELADLLGKYRRVEAELEEETFENIEVISKYKIEHSGKSELVGITESDDLNNLLPTELALFSDLETESIFYKRFAEKKLQTFQYINKTQDFEHKAVTDKRQKEVEKDKGPFIIAIDTSGSMHGEPEFLAKVITFAITKIALGEQRKAFLISFSMGIETIELTNIQHSLTKLIAFLQMSFHGGTDASAAVLETIKQMETENYEKADLLVISDGIFSSLNATTLASVEALKEKGNQFNALIIGSSYNKHALSFCQHIWQYDPNNDQLKDLVRKMKIE